MPSIHFISLLAITLISMQSLALAHFTLKYPSSRGFDENTEPTAPCGGFDTASTTQRVQMPLKGSFIEIDSGHTSYTYLINALPKNNPTSTDFTSANLVQVAQGGRNYPQAACLPIAFGDNLKANTNVTLQVVYNGGDGLLYQCIDAVLVDAAPNFNTSMCSNADGSSTSVATASSSAASPSSSSSNNKTNQGNSVSIATGLTFMAAIGISLLLA